MKVVVTGGKGQLGTDLVQLLSNNGYEVFGFGREELDFTNIENVKEVFQSIKPDVVIHSGAYTKVDLAESEPDEAYLVNAIGTRNIATVANDLHAKLLYVSTDYVFNGTSTAPINEFEPNDPIGVYGKSKLAGENFVKHLHSRFYIVRTSWVYGLNGNNFVKTMLKLGSEGKELSIVHDQVGCPTFTIDLAKKIMELIQTDKYGTYHISNSGQCSWFEFAQAIFEEANMDVRINPCTTKDFPRPAPRPAYSVFDHMGLRLNGFSEMPHWKDSLKEFMTIYLK
ncbi:dTDP-4-dehydrorhamnose reductase [Robertmurraya sp. Marseille-Q9965]